MLNYLYTLVKTSLLTVFYSLYTVWKGRGGNSDNYHKYALEWGKKLIKSLKINLSITGKEFLNNDENYVYISNHSSLIDIPVLIAALDDNIRIIYKKELEKIPLFGYGMKHSPFIAVSRDGGADALKTLNAAIEAMKENKSILIFPEGTRSKDGNLGEFKRGAFVLAERAGKKIVPVTVIGTDEILPKGESKFKKGVNVKVILSPPIELPEVKNKKTMLALIQSIHDIINDNLKTRRK